MRNILKYSGLAFSLLVSGRIAGDLLLYADSPSDLAVATAFVGMVVVVILQYLVFRLVFTKTKEKQ